MCLIMGTEENMNVGGILGKWFNCKNPFCSNGELSASGSLAYGKLIELLYDVGKITEIDMNDIVETLDNKFQVV